jgi:hypothetical protein
MAMILDGTNGLTTPGVVNTAGETIATNLTFTGTGNRITGDMSNATIANRVAFQTSTANETTGFAVLPNGTGTVSQLLLYNNSNSANSSLLNVMITAGEARFGSGIAGTGTYLPITFYTNGSERVRIDTSGNVLVTSPAGLGYGTGSGGTVTQATNKGTAVTLNKPTGQITMNNAALLPATSVFFDVNDSLVAATDNVLLTLSNFSALNYTIKCFVAAGKFTVILKNETAGSLSDAVVFNFGILKGATT